MPCEYSVAKSLQTLHTIQSPFIYNPATMAIGSFSCNIMFSIRTCEVFVALINLN